MRYGRDRRGDFLTHFLEDALIIAPFFLWRRLGPPQTALQAYCGTYKRAPVSYAHALLRKARRLDSLLHPHRVDVLDGPSEPDHQCDLCTTQYSPCFYRSRYYPDRWHCHKCHWSLQAKASGDAETVEEWPELVSPRASRAMQE